MDCLMDIIKNWGGHIMSVLGILGGLWAYFRHDRKIKSQEKMLNDLQIKQMKKGTGERKNGKYESKNHIQL